MKHKELDKTKNSLDYRLIFEKVPGLYLLLNPELMILDASEEYLKATLTTRDQLLNKYIFDAFPDNPSDEYATGVTNLKASLQRVLDQLKSDAMAVQKYDIRNSDGSFEERSWSPLNVPILDSHNQLKYILHTVEDVTEFISDKEKIVAQENEIINFKERLKALDIYKRAQEIQNHNRGLREEVMQQTEAFKDLFNAVPVGIIGITELGLVKYINQRAVEVFGYEMDDILNHSITELIYDSTFEKDGYGLLRLFNQYNNLNGNPIIQTEYLGIKKGGKLFPFELNISRNNTNNEKIILLSINDISERKLNEDQIKLYIKNIENKNKELEQFTYIASHDLQEPLRSISSFIELLFTENKENFNQESKVYYNYISKSTIRMRDLIKSLLDYSRIGKELEIELIDSTSILKEAIEDLTESAEQHQAIIEYSNLPVIKASALHLRILFQNLISNAIKFHKKDMTPIVEITCNEKDEVWEFCVKDNGIGIDSKYFDKIFAIFQRLHSKNEFEGTGIGLAHCKKIAQMHNGEIWFESQLNIGSKFYFTLSKNI